MQKLTKEQKKWLSKLILALLNKTIEHCYAKDKKDSERINEEITELWKKFYDNCEY